MYQRVAIMVILLIMLSLSATNAQDSWVARDGAVKNSELKDVIFGRDALYIATKSVLYKAKDIKERWEPVFSLPRGGSNEITCFAATATGAMFVGTRRGLFRSDDLGRTWKSVFRTILPDKNNITCVELSRHNRFRVLIATEKGIFSSDDLGARWQDISGILKNTPVKCLALNKESMYAGAESGLYIRRPDSENWERVFIRSVAEKTETEEPQESTNDNEEDASIRAIAIDGARVYIGYSRDIVYSDDRGRGWTNLSCEGLKGGVNHILISAKNKKIYCATEKGVFGFDPEKNRWLELYKGTAKSVNVSRLIFGSEDENIIFAVTEKGLYSFGGGDYLVDKYPDIEKSMNTLKIMFDGEPTYKDLQQAAMKFCDVSPEKIKDWHRESRMKALVPELSFDMDKHISTNSEIYTSATKDYVTVGPDDTYNAIGVSVAWDLGNLIWSDDQTNIDVRSRLTTQLRNDILDDLRRAYYERKRLQFELMTNPPQDTSLKFEKELRLQELTQAIDDLTGNYLSEHIKKK